MMPGRYAKREISSGFMGSIEIYAYRMPSAPDIDVAGNVEDAAPNAGEPTARLATEPEANNAFSR